MIFDLIVRNATLPDGGTGIDIACAGGDIAAIEPHLAAEAAETIDAAGHLVSPPFVDPHFHMDATLSLGIPRLNASGTLLEGIALWGELKPLLTHEAVRRARAALLRLAVSQGLLAIRTHVDVCDDRLLAVEALLDVKKRIAPYIDLQLVAFPQDGYYRSPTRAAEPAARARSRRRRGRRHPAFRAHHGRTARRSVKALCEIAARARADGRHALRRDRRPDVAPHRGARLRDAAARPARPRRRLASHLHALDGQLLRLEAACR